MTKTVATQTLRLPFSGRFIFSAIVRRLACSAFRSESAPLMPHSAGWGLSSRHSYDECNWMFFVSESIRSNTAAGVPRGTAGLLHVVRKLPSLKSGRYVFLSTPNLKQLNFRKRFLKPHFRKVSGFFN